MKTNFKLLFLISIALHFSSCSLFLGGGESADNKSHEYTVVRPDEDKTSKWKPLSIENNADIETDLSYQHTENNAFISLNSVCKNTSTTDLQLLTHQLLVGLPSFEKKEQKNTTVDGAEALETTVEIKEKKAKVTIIRTVVFKKGICTYDFMFVVDKKYFNREIVTFTQFVESFHVR